jgi:hypothetical protein
VHFWNFQTAQVVYACSLRAAIGGHMRGTVTAFLGVSEKLRKETNSFVMSVRLCVCPSVRMEQIDSNWADVHEILNLIIVRKFVEKIQTLKPDNNSRYSAGRPNCVLIIFHSFLLRMRNVSNKRSTKVQNTHSMFSNYFLYKTVRKSNAQPDRPQMTM